MAAPKLECDGFRWYFKQASAAASKSISGFVIEDCHIDLLVPVSRLQTIDVGIKLALAPLINHFSECLHGVLIAYSKLKILSAHIDLSDRPVEAEPVRVHGTFVIFRPKPGQTLEGAITRLHRHNVTCLVHKNFAASIRSESGSNVDFTTIFRNGQNIKFKYLRLENHNNITSIRGALPDEFIMMHNDAEFDQVTYGDGNSLGSASEIASGSDGRISFDRRPRKGLSDSEAKSIGKQDGNFQDGSDDIFAESGKKKNKKKSKRQSSVSEAEVPVDESASSVTGNNIVESEPATELEVSSSKKKKKSKAPVDDGSAFVVTGENIVDSEAVVEGEAVFSKKKKKSKAPLDDSAAIAVESEPMPEPEPVSSKKKKKKSAMETPGPLETEETTSVPIDFPLPLDLSSAESQDRKPEKKRKKRKRSEMEDHLASQEEDFPFEMPSTQIMVEEESEPATQIMVEEPSSTNFRKKKKRDV